MKTILLTITGTIAVLSFIGTLFLNTILGTFSLASISVETLNKFKSSQKIVEQMKAKHKVKQLDVTKKLGKRSTSRVASGALAATTIGTVAVALTMASFELSDYCETKIAL